MPKSSVQEAELVKDMELYGFSTLEEVVMWLERMPSILPTLTEEEALEVMAIHSIDRPFRAPHYNVSPSAIILW